VTDPSLEIVVRRLKRLLERRELVEVLAIRKLRATFDAFDAKPLDEMLAQLRTMPAPPYPLAELLPALTEMLDELEGALELEAMAQETRH
jgi:hypothetical protein